MKLLSVLSLIFLLSLSSCRYFGGEKIYGDGNIVTNQRNLTGFNSIEVSGAIEVHIVQGPESVKVTADQNLQEYIEIFTDRGVLVIQNKKNFNLEPTGEIKILVSAPNYTNLDVSGASAITSDGPITGNSELGIEASGASKVELNVNVPRLSVDISGACNVNLNGKSTDFVAQASGASNVKAFNLITENADVDLSGASEAEITANTKITVDASGASHVSYKGNASVAQNVSGAGSVKKVE